MATDYGGGLTSRKGNLTYNGKPTAAWNDDDVGGAWGAINSYGGNRNSNYWAEYAKIKPLYEAAKAASAEEEYRGMMAEAMAAMAKKMNAVEDAKEPLKKAEENMDLARDDVSRRQNLRSGLLSLYTRYGSGNMFQQAGTGSLSTKLGG